MIRSFVLRLPATLAMLGALALLAAACSDPTTIAAEGSDPGDVDQPASVNGFDRCPTEPVRFSASDDWYRDEPIYVGNNQPTEELRAWAMAKPAFEDLWIDRDRNGWVTLGFSEGADDRQAELEVEFPDVGVVAVAVPHTHAELEALRDRVSAALQSSSIDSWGLSHSVSQGVVSVDVPVLDAANLAPLETFVGEPLCVAGKDPADAVAEGPQPTEGGAWRLLGTEKSGESYRTGVATTAEQYDALWTISGINADAPPVDFHTEIVIWFGAVYGSGCEIRLDDVIIDRDRSLIYGQFVIPGNPVACNDDANPEAYVVAVDRSVLPQDGFSVQLRESDPPQGAPEERTVVTADLTRPGSTAAADDIGADQTLTEAPDRGYVVTAGGVMEPGFGAVYDLPIDCDFRVLGPFNGVVWEAENPQLGLDDPPSAWVGAAADGLVETELFLDEGPPPTLTVTAAGHTERYRPVAAPAEVECP